MRLWILAIVSIAAACGGSPAPEPAPSAPVASIAAPRASEADIVVAQVNGRPVWGSCVTEQAARGTADRRAALAECVDFELLAQAAENRGLATDTGVRDATRTAMVSELVATEFEARYQTPDDLRGPVDRLVDKNLWRLHRPELRASTYVRTKVPRDASPDVEARAKQIATDVATELANESGLLPPHLLEAMDRHAKGSGIEIETQDLAQVPRTASFERAYLDALFGIPEVGRISKPTRTTRGWDVILWTGETSPAEWTREQLANEVFPELRRSQFLAWVTGLIRSSGIVIARDQDALGKLDEGSR